LNKPKLNLQLINITSISDMKTASGLDTKIRFIIKPRRFLLWLGICHAVFAPLAFGQTNRAVTLELQCSGQQALTDVVITLRNSGNTGTAVVLGTRLGNIYLAKNLAFEARLASGQLQNFAYDNPAFSSGGGREDPWIVPLPAHSSYAVTISGNYFLAAASGQRMDEADSIADIQLRLTGSEIEPLPIDMLGLANWDVLVADMQSMPVAVPDDCK
jgi:hypothetical protein